MEDFGVVQRVTAGVLFSKSTLASDQTVQFAASTVTKMSSGLYFIDHATLLHWEHFFPGLAARWYDMITHQLRITGELLRMHTRATGPVTFHIHGVGYPKTLSQYYAKAQKTWTPLNVPLDDMQLLAMEFYAAREYSEQLGRAKLQFAHYSKHHDLVYANPIVKGSISLALMMHERQRTTPCYLIESTMLSVSTPSEKHRKAPSTDCPYVLTN